MVERIAKVFISFALALCALLVAVDNVIDHDTNFLFVRHVMSLDTLPPEGRLMGRAIHDPAWWQAAYALIIAGEALTGLLFLAGSLRMLGALRATAGAFAAAKAWSVLGATAGFGVWFLGFTVVGGEWFQMWQSPQWNGQEAAFRFSMTMLAALIFIALPDREV